MALPYLQLAGDSSNTQAIESLANSIGGDRAIAFDPLAGMPTRRWHR
ncbi:hypothetical protein [Baaleninema sp.]